MVRISQELIVVCWIAFLIYWLISALSTKRTAEQLNWVGRIIHRIPTALGAVLLFRPNVLSSYDVLIVSHATVIEAIAVALCVLGLLGAIWSRRTLAKNWSGEVVFKEQHELVERGPYQWVRHPIYTSILLMALGTALAVGRLGSFVGLMLLGTGLIIKFHMEESLLLRHFPNEYAAYKSRVKALVPFLW